MLDLVKNILFTLVLGALCFFSNEIYAYIRMRVARHQKNNNNSNAKLQQRQESSEGDVGSSDETPRRSHVKKARFSREVLMSASFRLPSLRFTKSMESMIPLAAARMDLLSNNNDDSESNLSSTNNKNDSAINGEGNGESKEQDHHDDANSSSHSRSSKNPVRSTGRTLPIADLNSKKTNAKNRVRLMDPAEQDNPFRIVEEDEKDEDEDDGETFVNDEDEFKPVDDQSLLKALVANDTTNSSHDAMLGSSSHHRHHPEMNQRLKRDVSASLEKFSERFSTMAAQGRRGGTLRQQSERFFNLQLSSSSEDDDDCDNAANKNDDKPGETGKGGDTERPQKQQEQQQQQTPRPRRAGLLSRQMSTRAVGGEAAGFSFGGGGGGFGSHRYGGRISRNGNAVAMSSSPHNDNPDTNGRRYRGRNHQQQRQEQKDSDTAAAPGSLEDAKERLRNWSNDLRTNVKLARKTEVRDLSRHMKSQRTPRRNSMTSAATVDPQIATKVTEKIKVKLHKMVGSNDMLDDGFNGSGRRTRRSSMTDFRPSSGWQQPQNSSFGKTAIASPFSSNHRRSSYAGGTDTMLDHVQARNPDGMMATTITCTSKKTTHLVLDTSPKMGMQASTDNVPATATTTASSFFSFQTENVSLSSTTPDKDSNNDGSAAARRSRSHNSIGSCAEDDTGGMMKVRTDKNGSTGAVALGGQSQHQRHPESRPGIVSAVPKGRRRASLGHVSDQVIMDRLRSGKI